jgi:hypothetical protein
MHYPYMRLTSSVALLGLIGGCASTGPDELPAELPTRVVPNEVEPNGVAKATTWCAEQQLPEGAACLDFDNEGMPGWDDYSFNNGGLLATSSEAAQSQPRSLRVEAPGTRLRQWSNDDPERMVRGVTIRASLRPDSEPSAALDRPVASQLLCVRVGRSEACLMHSTGAQTTFATSYTGYFLQWRQQARSIHPSIGLADCAVTYDVPALRWSEAVLTVLPNAVELEMDGGVARCDGILDSGTEAVVSIGLASPTPWGAYVDNLTVEVAR